MITTDRELLELAAKAAGIRLEWIGDTSFDCTKLKAGKPTCKGALWMPLHDDGDALRLAVAVSIRIEPKGFAKCRVWADSTEHQVIMSEKLGDDPYAATRRAITRAAAAIGKAKP